MTKTTAVTDDEEDGDELDPRDAEPVVSSGSAQAMQRRAATASYALQGYAVGWRRAHPDGGCPAIENIVADNQLPANAQEVTRDPWRRRFEIQCAEDDVRVRSAGPDGIAGTDDDISVRSTTLTR